MTAIVEKATGRLLMTISGPDEVIKLNTPEGCYATDNPPDKDMLHLDGEWIKIPPSPGLGYTFDYHSRQWVDERNIQDVREVKWSEIKMQRDQLEFGGFEYRGDVYDSDQVSQGRIMGAALAGADQVWTLADNTTVELSAKEIMEAYQAMQTHISSVHERGRVARLAIDSALTKEEVEDIRL